MDETINNRFEIISQLGEGGFGTVLLVRDREVCELCALKLVRPEFAADASMHSKFAREATIWMEMEKHPNVVSARSLDYFNGRLFIALEFIPPDEMGINSLDKHITRRRIPNALLLKWAIQVCQGMQHAAEKGVIAHRDLKPSNLMVDPGGTLKITDFGLAIFAIDSSNRYIDRSPAGTPVYMPPEQFVPGSAVGHRSDIYSLGLVLYQLATRGQLPFEIHCTDPSRFHAYCHNLHESYILPRLDNPIYPVIARCLEKHINDRYQSFSELESDLQCIYRKTEGHEYKAISLEEMNANEHINYAHSYIILDDPQHAMRHIDKALAIAPFFGPAKNNRAAILAQMGRIREATDIWRELTISNPELGRPFYNLGNMSMQDGDHTSAISLFQSALEREPDYVPAIVNMAICQQGSGDVPKALALYDRALSAAPNDCRILYNKAVMMLDNRDPVGAASLFHRVLQLNSNHVSAHNYLGVCHRTLEQLDEAIRCFDRALELNPAYSFAIINRQEVVDLKQKGR